MRTNDEHVCGGRFLPRHSLAVPSWVMPGSLADNCRFISGKADEVSLLFMESKTCLDYKSCDLPPALSALRLRFHIHLPVDLDIAGDPAGAARVCCNLFDKTAFLADCGNRREGASHLRGVLHPPEAGSRSDNKKASRQLEVFLRCFADMGGDTSRLLLENIRGNDLTGLLELAEANAIRICLDLGHALAYGQGELLQSPDLARMLGMLHLCAPGPAARPSRHMPLTCLTEKERATAAYVCGLLPPGGTVVVELFDWAQIEASLPAVYAWFA